LKWSGILSFAYIDKILEMIPGVSIKSSKEIREKEDIFEVHYPGFPVIPGSFQIEMMAQTAGKCLDAEKRTRGMAMLAQIKSASFREYIGPNTELIIYGKILSNRENYATADCSIEKNNQIVSKANLFFIFIPYDKLISSFRDHVLESYLLQNKYKGE